MNKLFTTAETAALDLATAAPASTIITAEEAKVMAPTLLQLPWLRKIAGLTTSPTVSADSQLVDAEGRKSSSPQSALCDLAASNPHVIATSVFSRKIR